MTEFASPTVPEIASAREFLATAAPSRLVSFRAVGLIVGFLDILAIIGSSVVAGVLYHLVALDSTGSLGTFIGVGLNSAALFVLLTASRGLYQLPALLQLDRQFRAITLGWIIVALAITSLLFFLKITAEYSRGATLAFDAVALPILLFLRIGAAAKLEGMMARQAVSGDRAIVIGTADELARVFPGNLLQSCGSREVGRFELPHTTDLRSSEAQLDLDIVDTAIDAARRLEVSKVILALPWEDTNRRRLVSERLRSVPAAVVLLPDQFVAPILAQAKLGLDSKIQVEIQRAPLSPTELVAKRVCDVALAGVSILLLAPMMILVSVAIALDSSGPIIFRQDRKGFNGKRFVIYKFRSLKVLENGELVKQVERNDSRVTRIGRVLRATSIDELPQLFNVLKGDMSLVGPRPHAVAHDHQYADLVADYALRHHVKPGITGWAQVNGFRGETARLDQMKGRVALDLWYVDNWSFWLDMKILGLTCIEVARRRNAF
jgi:undecaprenyl-phosphate galactose phosphotransferase/putative colanic acid biosynthesis UDP-glucose lipid carrier transferase